MMCALSVLCFSVGAVDLPRLDSAGLAAISDNGTIDILGMCARVPCAVHRAPCTVNVLYVLNVLKALEECRPGGQCAA